MNTLIELVFENVFFNHISQIIRELSQEGKQITNYSLQADWEIKGEINWHSADSITQILNQSTNDGNPESSPLSWRASIYFKRAKLLH